MNASHHCGMSAVLEPGFALPDDPDGWMARIATPGTNVAATMHSAGDSLECAHPRAALEGCRDSDPSRRRARALAALYEARVALVTIADACRDASHAGLPLVPSSSLSAV